MHFYKFFRISTPVPGATTATLSGQFWRQPDRAALLGEAVLSDPHSVSPRIRIQLELKKIYTVYVK
jgi:hypothetical protein